VSPARVSALMGKELREFRANPAAIVPMLILIVVCTLVPLIVLVLVPRLAGQTFGSDPTVARVVAAATPRLKGLSSLPPEAAAQAFFFQQFLFLFLLAPIVGAVSLAAYSVVGEKQGRTLEPLLTTPLTTAELLVAKVLAAFLPSLVIEVAGMGLYLLLVRLTSGPAVTATLLTARSAVLMGLMGPFASLAALQLTIAVSSRVNDPRSAQQIAVLVVLPVVTMLVGQIAGAFIVTTTVLLMVSLALGGVWVLLILFSVALFERETILTRWK
jgi:ABC-2 type transport system permease protein